MMPEIARASSETSGELKLQSNRHALCLIKTHRSLRRAAQRPEFWMPQRFAPIVASDLGTDSSSTPPTRMIFLEEVATLAILAKLSGVGVRVPQS
jgi:hypothetical protein